MTKSLRKGKRFLSIGIIAAALCAGVLVRASHYEPLLLSEAPSEGTISITDDSFTPEDQNLPAGADLLQPDLEISSDERGAGEEAAFRPAAGASSRKKSSKPDEPIDLKQMKKDIHSINRPPGDMKDYLDEAEKARRERIRRSLKEVREKVKKWEKSIFEPTW